MTRHTAIWLDHEEAHVFALGHETHQRITLKNAHRGHSDATFFHDITVAAGPDTKIFLCGPGLAKTAFRNYAEAHDPDFARRIVRFEGADHPSDGALVADARTFFRSYERMTA